MKYQSLIGLTLFTALALAGCSSGEKKQESAPKAAPVQNPNYGDEIGADADAAVESTPPPVVSSGPATLEMQKRFASALKAKQLNTAVEAAGEILARTPNDIKVLNGLGTLYLELGRLEAARLVFSKALAIDANNSSVHNNLGLIELKNKNLRGALNEFKKAIQLDGENRHAHANLGTVYLQYRNYQAAAQELGVAVDEGDKRPEILSNYAYALRGAGQIEKSVEIYEKALEKDARNHSIMLNFATLLVEHANRPKRGLKVINKIRMLATEPDILEKASQLAKKAEAASKMSQEKESPGDTGL